MNENQKLTSSSSPASDYNIWRIDPTGQFWTCALATVGRGAGYVEHAMLEHVYKWKQEQKEDMAMKENDNRHPPNDIMNGEPIEMDELLSVISHEDVKNCWKNMSFDNVIEFISDCICNVYGVKDVHDLQKVGVEGLLITKVNCDDKNNKRSHAEMIHDQIIKECLRSKVPKLD